MTADPNPASAEFEVLQAQAAAYRRGGQDALTWAARNAWLGKATQQALRAMAAEWPPV